MDSEGTDQQRMAARRTVAMQADVGFRMCVQVSGSTAIAGGPAAMSDKAPPCRSGRPVLHAVSCRHHHESARQLKA
jgi:hypothetical protein